MNVLPWISLGLNVLLIVALVCEHERAEAFKKLLKHKQKFKANTYG